MGSPPDPTARPPAHAAPGTPPTGERGDGREPVRPICSTRPGGVAASQLSRGKERGMSGSRRPRGRRGAALVAGCLLLGLGVPVARGDTGTGTVPRPAGGADVVLHWNGVAQHTVSQVPDPFLQVRSATITQVAVFEAVNAIVGRYQPYLGTVGAPPGAPPEAAAIAAAHRALTRLHPDPGRQPGRAAGGLAGGGAQRAGQGRRDRGRRGSRAGRAGRRRLRRRHPVCPRGPPRAGTGRPRPTSRRRSGPSSARSRPSRSSAARSSAWPRRRGSEAPATPTTTRR
jgi:hypothetical protein